MTWAGRYKAGRFNSSPCRYQEMENTMDAVLFVTGIVLMLLGLAAMACGLYGLYVTRKRRD